MDLQEIMEMDARYYMNTFGPRTPVCFEYGKGMMLYGSDGRGYYDLLGGVAVNALGHAHPALVEAVCSQARKFIHCSSLYYIESQAKLAKMLAEVSCADRVFFSNSGAEANEGAVKLAKIYFKKRGIPEKYGIITLRESFHGRTLATTAATGQEKYQAIRRCRRVQARADKRSRSSEGGHHDGNCAVMMELVRSESGVHLLDADYVHASANCATKRPAAHVDEIQTGMGRTGNSLHMSITVSSRHIHAGKGAGEVPIGRFVQSMSRRRSNRRDTAPRSEEILACSAGWLS